MLMCRVQHQLNPQRLNHLYRIARSLNSVERTKLTLVINAGSLVGTTTIAAWVKNAMKYLLVHILTLLGPIITFAVQVSNMFNVAHQSFSLVSLACSTNFASSLFALQTFVRRVILAPSLALQVLMPSAQKDKDASTILHAMQT